MLDRDAYAAKRVHLGFTEIVVLMDVFHAYDGARLRLQNVQSFSLR